jgi:hypothetical protein
MNKLPKQLPDLKKDFNNHIKSIAINGLNNIKSELLKRGKKADVSFKIINKKIKFIVKPIIEDISKDKISKKQMQTTFKAFENIPIELLNQEISKEEFHPDRAINVALEQTQKQSNKWMQQQIKRML